MIYTYVYVCMGMCVWVCMYGYVCIRMNVCIRVCMCILEYVCMKHIFAFQTVSRKELCVSVHTVYACIVYVCIVYVCIIYIYMCVYV